VTGYSSGIGKSLATTIYNAGHHIVPTARDVTYLSYLPDGPAVLKLYLGVTRQETIANAIIDAVDKFHGIDVFINNAGYSLMGDTEGETTTSTPN
jgi:NADP-dependent 3-hydroxy acid dehydrogenase YdfG